MRISGSILLVLATICIAGCPVVTPGDNANDNTANDNTTNDNAANDNTTNDNAANDNATNDNATNDNAANDNGTANDNTNDNLNDNGADDTVEVSLSAALSGDQEVPAVTTTASGSATFVLNAERTELSFSVMAEGFAETVSAAHFHNAPAGVSGDVVFDLGPFLVFAEGTVTIEGSAPLSEWAIANAAEEILAGNVYVNLHTPTNPAGEIRGQLVISDDGGDGMLTGDAENGGTLFAADCAGCHGADASGGFGPNIQGEDADNITLHVIHAHDGHQTFLLSEQEILDIEVFLAGF